MSRPSTAEAEWPIPGRPGRFVRLHRPAAGKRSWRVVYHDTDGRTRERTLTDRDHAVTLAEKLVRALGDDDRVAFRGRDTIRDLVDYYMTTYAAERGWSAGYRQERSHAIRLLPDWFLDTIAEEWRTYHADKVLTHVASLGHNPGMREYERVGSLMSGLVSAAERGDFLRITVNRTSPMRGVKYRANDFNRRQVAKTGDRNFRLRHIRPVPPELIPARMDVDGYVKAAASYAADGRWAVHGDLLAHSGLRLAESLRVTIDDFNLDPTNPYVHVWRQLVEIDLALSPSGRGLLTEEPPKNGHDRKAWFPPSLIPHLQRLADATPGRSRSGEPGPIFAAPEGGFMRPNNWRKRVFNPAAAELAWPKVPKGRIDANGHQREFWLWTPHSFRHYAATWMLKDLGIPSVRVAETLGHADSAITERLYLDHSRTDYVGLSTAFTAWQERENGTPGFRSDPAGGTQGP